MDGSLGVEKGKNQPNVNCAHSMMKRTIKGLFHRAGFDIIRYRSHQESDKESEMLRKMLRDMTDHEIKIVQSVRPYTLTDEERIAALMNAVGYVVEQKVPGNIAECGVWRGGSMMAVALALM